MDTDLRDLAERVDEEGGETAFVHRALWDPGFDPDPTRRVPVSPAEPRSEVWP